MHENIPKIIHSNDQESQAKLQFEIYDKLEAANQRREEIIKENISGKLSETLSKKLQKANEVKENEMSAMKTEKMFLVQEMQQLRRRRRKVAASSQTHQSRRHSPSRT